ncbi:uncharacterized protein FOMMEDRAFT_154620 [Fomitiporia mediterranea MF3/22]|uniref:uncharacterized protein n=1 Tax=Fomitiporia mediterranea (strain MF3/22) TaxID=694068 RepID=UPI0004409B7F|nr:uncharacterized protein FOMMEDRAFT_154620 [Fomitiporia mediterranea MF3/22]EJD03544.1 hypothetical protein FOMMEDRAFT_154620 [Fomitiporia mediterranea MF3/22]
MTLEVRHSVVAQTASGTKRVTTCDTSKSDKAPRATPPLILTCDVPTTPRRSPKKTDRILVEKGVGTTGSKRERKPLVSRETPTTIIDEKTETVPDKATVPSPGLLLAKKIRKFMASSQVSSYYEGDDEFLDLLKQVEEHEGTKSGLLPQPSMETLPPTVTITDSSSSAISTLSNPTMSSSSIPTLAEDNHIRRRKRADSPVSDCPRTKPRRETSPKLREKPQTDVSRREIPHKAITIEASHSRKTKQDRPIPRSMHPGQSAPVDTSGVIQTRLESTGSSVDAVVRVEAVEIVEIKDDDEEIVEITTPKKAISAVTERQTKTKEPRPSAGPKAPTKSLSATDKPLPVVIVAHDERKQRLLDEEGIEKGIQYEIARGITHGWWAWEDITIGVVKQLRGTNFEKAGKVAEVIGGKHKERLSPAVIKTRQDIYAELDREQKAFLENKGRGLGLMGTWDHKENWHGGRVQLTAKLDFNKDGYPPYTIRLNSFGIGKSNRAARRFTSLSILQVKYDDGALYDDKRKNLAHELFSKPLILCGRQYVLFCTKENKAFFVEIREGYERKPMRSIGDHYRMSFRKFVQTVNPMALNKEQAMSKWLTRWQLILSTTRPVVEFQHENIFLDLEDIYGGDPTVNRKAESIMTDGCGLINLSALKLIAEITGQACPVVVQGRIAGAKGLWILHPDPEHRKDDEPPKIWIRASQLKIKLGSKETWDRSLRIFDLVRLPRLTVPSSLNFQTIINMSYNGVKDKVFENLMETGLKKEIEALTKWDADNACLLLAKAVQEAGGIMGSRRSRGAGADARLHNYVPDEDEDAEENKITSGGLVERDPISGCPLSLYESTYEMLRAGFTPLKCPVLREKLKNVLTQTVKAYQDNYHVPVPRSAEAFIAPDPDPHGVLEEDEIFFRCSEPISDPTVSIDPHTFLGPVLVSRNPTRVASDVQKVTAVHHDKLLSYTDVIIFSVKGARSLANYDGDTVTVFAEPALVDAFSNSDYVAEPPTVRAAFQEEVEKVSVFLDRMKGMGREERRTEIAKKVLTGLSDGKVGLYSNMHDNVVYSTGYNNSEAIRLAYMFTTCLDASKSGLRIKSDVIIEDRKRWDAPRPECMQKSDEIIRNQYMPAARSPLVRSRSMGRFVLESLRKCAKDLSDNALISYEKLCDEAERNSSFRDTDLSRPYEEMKDFANRLQENYRVTRLADDLLKIEEFVVKLCNEYVSKFGSELGSRSPQKSPSKAKTAKARPMAQITNEFARRFEEELPDDSLEAPAALVKEVKASYAHIYGSSKSKLARGFAFAVAHDTVCAIKVRTRGGSSTVRECRDFTLVSPALVKVLHTDQE